MPNLTVLLSLVAIPAYLALCFFSGRLLLRLLTDRPEAVSTAGVPLLGAAALGLQLWLYGIVHMPWNPISLLLPWLLAGWVMRRRLREALAGDWAGVRAEARAMRTQDRLGMVLAILTGLLAFIYLLNLVTEPLTGFDAISMWFFKAKHFFLSHSVDLGSIPGLNTYQPGDSGPFRVTAGLIRSLDYPPLYSLMVASVYALVGGVHDTLGKGVDFLFIVVAAAITWTALAPVLGRRLAILLTFLVTAIPTVQAGLGNPIYTGYADYAFGVAMLASLANLQKAWNAAHRPTWVLAIVFAAIAALMKSEGLPLLIFVLVLAASRARRVLISPAVVASVCLLVAWQVAAAANGWRSHHLLNDSLAALPSILLPIRAVKIAAYTVIVLVHKADYMWLAASYAVTVWLVLRGAKRAAGAALVVLTLQFATYFAVFALNPGELTGTIDRLAIQAAPALLLVLGLAIASTIPEQESQPAAPHAEALVRETGVDAPADPAHSYR